MPAARRKFAQSILGIAEFLAAPMSDRRLVIVNLAANYSYTLFLGITGIVMVPLYLRYIPTDVYGGWLATGNLVALMSVFDMGLNLIITQKLSAAQAMNDDQGFAEIAGTAALISLVVAGIIGVCVWNMAAVAPNWVNLHGEKALAVTVALRFSAIAAGLSVCLQNMNGAYQALRAPMIPASLNLLSLAVSVVSVWISLRYGLGVVALGVSMTLRQLVPLLISFPLFIWFLRLRSLPMLQMRAGRLREYARSGLPTMGSRLLGIVAGNCQEFLVGAFVSPSAAANFSLTKRLPDLCGSIFAPIGSSAFSTLSASGGEDESRRVDIVRKLMSISTFIATLLLSVCVLVNASFVTTWVGPKQYGGTLLTVAIAFAILINARFGLLSFVAVSQGMFRGMAFWGMAQSATQIGLLTALAYLFGPLGLPLSTALATALLWGIAMPRLFASRFGPGHGLVWFGIGPSLLVFCISACIAFALPVQHSALGVIGIGLTAALALTGVLLAMFPETRHLAVDLVMRLRRRV